MRTPTTAGGLLPAGTTSIATRTTFDQPRRRFCPTEKTDSERTSTQYTSYYSNLWRINNQIPAPSWQRVIQAKSMQTLMFDPGESTDRLRACPGFWECGARYFVGRFSLGRWMRQRRFFADGSLGVIILQKGYIRILYAVHIADVRCFSADRLIRGTVRTRRHEAVSAMGMDGCRGTPWSEELDDKKLHGALGRECDLEPRGFAVSWTSSTWSTHISTSTISVVLC